ncbi:MAG: hypothetical protein ACD_79C01131G0005 [uncultured bacterium]|nr:MAG: hypothetical protein ACD_79C01131G0005 [uncultured bacterium]
MKILVTGGAGFIGSHLVDRYLSLGHEVCIIDNLVTGDKSNINPKAKFINADITDKAIVDIICAEKFDIVSHHAAQIDVRIAVEDPIYDARVNILGSLNILNACVQSKVKRIIFASSGGAVYGEIPEKKLPPGEKFQINPISPYGVTKHAIEHYLYQYNKIYNIDYVVLRYGNVYGERQSKKGEAGVVTIFLKELLAGKSVTIYGSGEQLRDYIYVGDIVDANMKASFAGKKFTEVSDFNDNCFNIGTGKGYSVNLLYKHISEFLGVGKPANYAPERKGEILKTYLKCSKAKKELGWTPKTTFKNGVIKTSEWFKENI